MRLSDLITKQILDILNESEGGTAEIQRNELANSLGCVPSQINYVLSSRFTPENGYIIESRRGGGGYIRITRVRVNRASAIMHIINSIGGELDPLAARILIENCLQGEIIDRKSATLILAAVSDNTLGSIPVIYRDTARASLMKQMLLSLM
ncbi:MAG: CtsR family transcriptional regulator [Clostridia bacterium]|nr:CtsR family transcriptional regulator [Clostridia bacterium]